MKCNSNNNSTKPKEKTPGFKWNTLPKDKWKNLPYKERRAHIRSEYKCLNEFKKQLKANNHNQQNSNTSNTGNPSNSNQSTSQNSQNSTSNSTSSNSNNTSIQNATKSDDETGSLMRTMLSNSHAQQLQSDVIVHDAKCYIQQNLTYRVHKNSNVQTNDKALVDRGANGRFSGGNVLKISTSDTQKVDVIGIKDLNVQIYLYVLLLVKL